MASMEYWFRSWHGAPMDHKYSVIGKKAKAKTGVVSAVMWALLDYASQQPRRGDVKGFDTEAYSVFSGFAESQIISIMDAMTEKGIIHDGHLTNWEKRQPKSESEIQRVTDWRNKKRGDTENYDMLQDVTKKYTDTDTDTDTDSETDTEKEEESPPDLFDAIRIEVEKRGILLSGEADINSIQEIIRSGATIKDVIAGTEWKIANKRDGRPIRYVGQIVEPTKTAMRIRLQQNGNGQSSEGPTKKMIEDPEHPGEFIIVPIEKGA